MSAKPVETPAEPRVSLDDLRHQAESLKAQAVTEAKGVADTIVQQEATKTILVVAGVVVLAASLAYFLGTRSGRAMLTERAE